MMRRIIPFFLLLSSAASVCLGTDMVLQKGPSLQVELEQQANGIIAIKTTGDDPQVIFTPEGDASIPEEAIMLAFEYFCPDGIGDLEVFYARNLRQAWSPDRMIQGGVMPKAEAWQPFAVNMSANGNWTPDFSAIRLDFGRLPHVSLQIRNVHFRAPTATELAGEVVAREIRRKKRATAAEIDAKLEQVYATAEIQGVAVSEETILIRGTLSESVSSPVILLGFEPHENEWEAASGSTVKTISPAPTFEITVPRFEEGRDRIAYRWAIAWGEEADRKRLTAAVWASDLSGAAERDMPRLRPANRKGLTAVTDKRAIFDDDLRDLGITAGSININLTSLLVSSDDTIPYVHQGKTWHFSAGAVRAWDHIIRELTKREIVVSAVLLITGNHPGLVHPDYEPAGVYSMADLTNREAADTYRAAVSFLAERYSRPEKEHGWVTHWIVFNEVDYGWVWTNMGEQPMSTYMDTYHRAMRLTWLEAVRFNPTAEVFISLTHRWDYEPGDPFRVYPPRALLDRLAHYTEVGGDFHWGVAYHPYPQSLLSPRTWEDSDPTARFDTPYITAKNIEVLDAYLRQEEFLHRGSPRTILLSEQGYHTPDYSEKSLTDKAAAIAYTWQKMAALDTVETYHYHRWVDHPMEGGLRLGLRTLPSEDKPYGERKQPAFSVLAALETEDEARLIAPLMEVIGIESWDEIRLSAEEIER